MGKPAYTPNPKVTQIFDDLEKYLEFCCEYGYRYSESDLYNWKSYAYQQYSKATQNKNAKNMWDEDLRRFTGSRA